MDGYVSCVCEGGGSGKLVTAESDHVSCVCVGKGGVLVTAVGGHVSWCSIHLTRLGAGLKVASEINKRESCPSACRFTKQLK